MKLLCRMVAPAALLTLGALGVEAQTTYVDPAGGGGSERCLVGVDGICQGGTYGGAISIVRAVEMDLNVSLVRVDDGLDQIWQALSAGVNGLSIRSRYAADELRLGYDSGTGYVERIDNIPSGQVHVRSGSLGEFTDEEANYADSFATISNWQSLGLNAGTLFAFILNDMTTQQRWTSNNSGSGVGSGGYANSSNLEDHVVAFRITPTQYLIAWEDRPLLASDRDYNDMVLEVNWVAPVPLPAALPLLLSGLLGFAGLARARRRVAG
jgi:uncharacterized protein DUF4114